MALLAELVGQWEHHRCAPGSPTSTPAAAEVCWVAPTRRSPCASPPTPRISTDEERQPYSLGPQDERLGNYIASQEGWERARTFSDQRSGAALDRPGMQKALAEARAGATTCSSSTGWTAWPAR